MPFYAGNTRVNLNSASSLYQPADSSGAACNLGSVSGGTATPFYANGTQIYIKPAGSWHTVWTGNKLLASQSSTTLRGLPLPSGKLRIYIKVTPNYWEQAEGYAEEGSLPKEYKGYYSDDASRFYSWECYQIDGVAASASDTYDGSITVYMRKGAGADTQGSNISYDRIYMTKIECQGSW